jgi:hypothetical protein
MAYFANTAALISLQQLADSVLNTDVTVKRARTNQSVCGTVTAIPAVLMLVPGMISTSKHGTRSASSGRLACSS